MVIAAVACMLSQSRNLFKATALLVAWMLGCGATMYVSKDGSGDFVVIQDALDAAAEGDSILIAPGRYDDFRLFDWAPVGGNNYAIVGISTDAISIVGIEPSQVIVGPADPVDQVNGLETLGIAVNHERTDVTVSGLTFENTHWGGVVSGEADFENCHFRDSGLSNLVVNYGQGIFYINCSFSSGRVDVYSVSSTVSEVTFLACEFGPFAGLTLQAVEAATVDDCKLFGTATAVVYSNSTGSIQNSKFESNDLHVASRVGAEILLLNNQFSSGSQISISCAAQGFIEAHGNSIGGGQLATVSGDELSMSNQMTFTGNDIYHLGGPSVAVDGLNLSETVYLDFSDNYWGTTDTNQIDTWIDDGLDWGPRYPNRKPTVQYLPLRDSSVPVRSASMGSLKLLFDSEERQ